MLFDRIVVGTDGSETAAEAVRQATELAKLSGASARARERLRAGPAAAAREEQSEVPGDVAYGVGPREDVNITLEAAAGPARNERIEATTHAREGDPADAILDVAEETTRT